MRCRKMQTVRIRRRAILLNAIALTALITTDALAVSQTWKGMGAGPYWSNSSNWTSGTLGNGDSVTFDMVTPGISYLAFNAFASYNLISLTINNFTDIEAADTSVAGSPTTSAVTLTGDAGTYIYAPNGSQIGSTSGSKSVNLGLSAITGTATGIIYVGSGTLTIGGFIGGDGGINKTGTGVLLLTAAQANVTATYTGGAVLTAGTLAFGTGANSSYDPLGNGGSLTIDGGTLAATSPGLTLASTHAVAINSDFAIGTSFYTGPLIFAGPINLGGSTRTLTVSNASTFSGSVSNGGITKLGTGTLVLSGSNSYTLGTTVTAGTIRWLLLVAQAVTCL